MRLRYEKCMTRRSFSEPLQPINEWHNQLKTQEVRIQNSIMTVLKDKQANMNQTISKLDALSPLKTLTRGFSLTEKDGKLVKSAEELKSEDEIKIKFYDGERKAKIM